MRYLSGAPNDGFLQTSLKTFFRLSRVLLDLLKCILSGSINLYLFGRPKATWVFYKLQGLQFYFPENLRCNLTYFESEKFSDSSFHYIFDSENSRFSFFSTKISQTWGENN